MPEVIPIGSDHAGVELKARLVEELRSLGYEPLDLGTTGTASVDYPDFAHDGGGTCGAPRGCGAGCCSAAPAWGWRTPPTGIRGCARRWPGAPEIARLAREHNDANVLVLPARFVSGDEGIEILKTWLATEFAGGRHGRRVAKIDQEQG